ncbi:nucleotidyltransferase family protein [Candidatus Woesearchaeota archaeon]|nr:nucleotidyltransferase family protein [Candidatus Woesearchaeota archaeon]
MKAIILAAGYGTRLGVLTENTAKPLLRVAGKTILDHIVEKVRVLPSVTHIYVVTNHKFYLAFELWRKTKTNLPLTILDDGTMSNEDRLGSIGDIDFVIKTEKIVDDLLIVGGDNLFEDQLHNFISFFKKNGSSIMLHDVKSRSLAQTLGIAAVSPDHKISSFIEKPEHPPSTLASTLIYALRKEHLSFIEKALEEGKADRAGDFIKFLSEQQAVYGKLLEGKWFDIGTPESLKDAEEFFTP